MFAAAVAPHDVFVEHRVQKAMALLGNNPNGDLECAYCGGRAETWDHVFATVKDSKFSGYGHRLGNLLPCCKPCNSRKGNRSWQAHLAAVHLDEAERSKRAAAILLYLRTFGHREVSDDASADHRRLDEIRRQILALMAEADEVAACIRERAASADNISLRGEMVDAVGLGPGEG